MNDILKHVLEAAKAIAPAIVPGAGPVLVAGKHLLEALEAGKDMFEPGDQSEANGTIASLQTAINAEIDDEIAALRG